MRIIPHLLAIGLLSGPVRAANLHNPTHSAEVTPGADLCLHIVSGQNPLDAPSIRAAIEKELGLPTSPIETTASVGTVSVESGLGPFVTVRYKAVDGSSRLERRIAMPRDPERRATVIAWLVGNLVRNEANEILLAILERKAAESRALELSSRDEHASATSESPSDAPHEQVEAPHTKASHAETTAGTSRMTKPNASRTDIPAAPAKTAPDLSATHAFHGALYSPTLDTDANASSRTFGVSLGAAYSRVGAMRGFGLGLFVEHLIRPSSGAELAGLWIEANQYDGFLLSGLGTHSRGDLRGAELAGIAAWRKGSFDGVQLAGVLTATSGRGTGLQVSGLVAYTGNDVDGTQLAGAANIAGADTQGLQLSAILNYQRGDVDGAQITGALNHATDVRGLQLSLVNVARDVDGVQLGIVNVSRHTRGLALGLFNWSESARLQPAYFFQTPGYHNAGYRTVSGYTTGTVSFGYDPSSQHARTHFATGPRMAIGRFAIGAELGYGWVLENMTNGPSDRAHELDLIGNASAEIVRRVVSVYAGGGLVLPVAGTVPIEPRGLAQVGISVL